MSEAQSGTALREAIARRKAGGEPALVAFITAGYPRRDDFRKQLEAVGAAADIVEIGVPFTDPMADGATIQRSSQAALEQGVTLQWILEELTRARHQASPLVLMSYLNPLMAFGLERLADAVAAAGVCGFIVPDLPVDEADELRDALDTRRVALIQMVTPVTTAPRRAQLLQASRGFVYAVTMTGTTGREVTVPEATLEYLREVRAGSPLPVCAGFGIRSKAQVERLAGVVDGVIVGSALVEALEQGRDPQEFLQSLR
ncbi:MAG: tryptophan synthase subunit alpha [Steroidobacteraceae bacterium]